MRKFNEGDTVVLKSGGAQMVVFGCAIDAEGRFIYNLCHWSEDEKKFKTLHTAESLLMSSSELEDESEKIKAGDVIQLKSGGPDMTVTGNEDDMVSAVWYCDHAYGYMTGEFVISSIKKNEA